MANSHKGEVEFSVGKKVYTLVYSINSMCELEDALGMSVLAMADAMSDSTKISIKSARTLFWAGLKDNHQNITQAEAGNLMTAIGLPQAMDLIGKSFTAAFPTGDAQGPLAVPSQPASTGRAH